MDLLTSQRFEVARENDVVFLNALGRRWPFSYTTATRIAQGLRLAAGVVLRVQHVPLAERQEVKRALPDDAVEQLEQELLQPIVGELRRSSAERFAGKWQVDIVGSLVALKLGPDTITLEGDSAATLAGWFRTRAREAKHWAGDTGWTIRASGILTDAEQAYRTGAH